MMVCDRCKRVDPDRGPVTRISGSIGPESDALLSRTFELDLCDGCYELLQAFLGIPSKPPKRDPSKADVAADKTHVLRVGDGHG